MPLSMQGAKSNGGTSSHVRDGFFVDVASIKTVKDVSGQTTARMKYPMDLAVEVTFILSDKGWESTLTIGGNFQKDPSGAVKGWGGAFKVERFFQASGALDQKVDLTHDSKLPTEVLQAAIGKEVKLLSYPNTKDSTSKWDIVSHANSDSGAFVDYFVEQYEKSKARKNGPYPKNFRVDDPSDSFEFGANREEPAPQVSSL